MQEVTFTVSCPHCIETITTQVEVKPVQNQSQEHTFTCEHCGEEFTLEVNVIAVTY